MFLNVESALDILRSGWPAGRLIYLGAEGHAFPPPVKRTCHACTGCAASLIQLPAVHRGPIIAIMVSLQPDSIVAVLVSELVW